jgi:hypothetical protein
MLREQMDLLHASLDAFYQGNFAESLRIATIIRVLVHETSGSKPLLTQLRPGGLDLEIPEQVGDARPGQEELLHLRFAVGVRLGSAIAPAVDLRSSHYSLSTVGSWWGRTVFTFPTRVWTQVVYTRKKVVLILANREGGAHVDPNEDYDYVRLLTDQPLSFDFGGVQIETPDLARFLVAQSGVEMLACLKRNFFHDSDVPSKWEYGAPPPVAQYLDEISLTERLVIPAFPRAKLRVTKRET